MPKKPTPPAGNSRKRTASNDDPVAAEKRKLIEAQEELRRKQEKLQRLIQQAPARVAEKKKKQREPIQIRVSAPTAMSRSGSLRDKYGSVGEAPPRRRARRSERNMARVQFLILCLILATIVFLIWRSI